MGTAEVEDESLAVEDPNQLEPFPDAVDCDELEFVPEKPGQAPLTGAAKSPDTTNDKIIF